MPDDLFITSSTPVTPTATDALVRWRELSVQAQIDSFGITQQSRTLTDLPRIRISEQTFVLARWLHRNIPKRSFIYSHGFALVEVINGEAKGPFWLCHLCDKKGRPKAALFKVTTTTSPTKHLKREHRIVPTTQFSTDDDSSTSSPASRSLALMRANSRASKEALTKAAIDDFKQRLLHWIVEANVPLSAVEHDTFQHLILTPSDVIERAMPQHHQTVKNWLMADFAASRGQLQEDLRGSHSMVHLTFDTWTSPNQQAILGIVCHFLDQQHLPVSRLLGLKQIIGPHSGENLAPLIHSIIESFNLPTIGFIVADNASSNDTCIRHLFQTHLSSAAQNPALRNTAVVRLRCFGHIINLVARAFLDRVFLRSHAPQASASLPASHRDLAHSSVTKLHSVVTFIRRSPQRRQQFQEFVNQHRLTCQESAEFLWEAHHNIQLCISNDTRWKSTFAMIEHALHLQKPVSHWIAVNSTDQPDRRLPQSDHLYKDDWDTLRSIRDLLLPLYEETMRFESRDPGNIGWVLRSLFRLISHFNAARDHENASYISSPIEHPVEPRRTQRRVIPNSLYDQSTYQTDWFPSTQQPQLYHEPDESELRPQHTLLYTACEAAIEKLESYKELLDQSPAYWAAAILHPGLTMKWVTNAVPHRADSIQQRFETFFKEGWSHQPTEPAPTTTPDVTRSSRRLPDLLPSSFYEEQASGHGNSVRELQAWLSHPAEPVKCPVKWWLQHQASYPLLAKMALDILTIPPMSAECERIFSRAKLTFGSQRHSLADTTLEAIECLRSWKAGY